MTRFGSNKGKNPSNSTDLLENFGRCYVESFERYLTRQQLQWQPDLMIRCVQATPFFSEFSIVGFNTSLMNITTM
jgi:hypothetical protein